ncbi:UNVERIFIED_ORG: hypothetical protein QOE_0073 [Clostridioides difficile F501]
MLVFKKTIQCPIHNRTPRSLDDDSKGSSSRSFCRNVHANESMHISA